MPAEAAGYDAGLQGMAGPVGLDRFSTNSSPVVDATEGLGETGFGPHLGFAQRGGRDGTREFDIVGAPDPALRRAAAGAGKVARRTHPHPGVPLFQSRRDERLGHGARDRSLEAVALVEHDRRRQIDLTSANLRADPPRLTGSPTKVVDRGVEPDRERHRGDREAAGEPGLRLFDQSLELRRGHTGARGYERTYEGGSLWLRQGG